MMQPELLHLQHCWPADSHHLNMELYAPQNHHFLSDEFIEYPPTGYYHHMPNPAPVTTMEIEEGLDAVNRWLCDDDQAMDPVCSVRSTGEVWSPSLSTKSTEASGCVSFESGSPTVQPELAMGLENLLQAYGEAMGMGQGELAGVITKCIFEKVSPVGRGLERIAHGLFQCAENHKNEYLKQESKTNFEAAFKAFYDIFPYGRFAHFTANSAILEAVPTRFDSIHIVDFDIGEGIQWPPIIEAMAHKRKHLKITSVRLEEHGFGFEETKTNLINYARTFGLNLKVEEMDLEHLVKKMENTKSNRDFLAFNCMVGLPHMGRTRRRTQITEFLEIAKGVLAKTEGIITFGDGEDGEWIRNSSDNYTLFFEGYLAHYKAIYESIEWGFPSYLIEARVAMETLFVAPFVSSLTWFQNWEKGGEFVFSQKGIGLNGHTMSAESLNEAREMVKEGESPYNVRVAGNGENEMVLEWRGTSLLRVSAWM